MEYENENFENEEFSEDIELQIQTNIQENIEDISSEDESIINGTDSYNNVNSDTSSSTIALEETQYNEIISSISLLNHTNYLLCALLLTIFIYLFLRDMFERRKI